MEWPRETPTHIGTFEKYLKLLGFYELVWVYPQMHDMPDIVGNWVGKNVSESGLRVGGNGEVRRRVLILFLVFLVLCSV